MTHSEDGPDHSTWVAAKNVQIPINLKNNEFFVRFLQEQGDDPDEISLRWETTVSGRPDTSKQAHGYFYLKSKDFVESSKACIDGWGTDDGHQFFEAKLKIPYRVFVDL